MTIDRRRGRVWGKPALIAAAIVVASGIGVGVEVGAAHGADDRTATYGTIPEDAYGADGSIDVHRVPDYVVAFGRDGEPVGYVAKADLFAATGAQTVFARDGSVVGHLQPGYGFVAVGEDPRATVPIPATAGPVTEN